MKNPRLGRGMFILVIAGVLPASGGGKRKKSCRGSNQHDFFVAYRLGGCVVPIMQLAAGARAFFSRKNRRDRSERRTQNTGPWGDSAGPAGLPGSIGRCAQDHVPQGVAGRAQHRECRGQKASGDGDGAEQEIWCIQRSQDEIECACYWQAGARYPSICKLRRCRMADMSASACRHQVTADHTAMGSDIPR